MNVRESAAYFESIGLQLTPSNREGHRWSIMIPSGHGLVMHFTSIEELWRLFKANAHNHFQQALTADRIIEIVRTKSHPEWVQVEEWFQSKYEGLPGLIHRMSADASQSKSLLPYHWLSRYARLINNYGSPEWPLLGRALRKGLLALHQGETALCAQASPGRNHAKRGTAQLGRSTVNRQA